MNTYEITRRLEEPVCQVRNLLSDADRDSPLQPRGLVEVSHAARRGLPDLSLEDLFEAEMGRIVYGRSLLMDTVTHQPLEVEHVLQALAYSPEVIRQVVDLIRRTLTPTIADIQREFNLAPFVTFWFRYPSILTVRVITGHDNRDTECVAVGGAYSSG